VVLRVPVPFSNISLSKLCPSVGHPGQAGFLAAWSEEGQGMTIFRKAWLTRASALLLVGAGMVAAPALSRGTATPAAPVAASDVGLKLGGVDIAVVHEHQLADGTNCLVVAGMTAVVVTCPVQGTATPAALPPTQ
jgi:hypothetical protein